MGGQEFGTIKNSLENFSGADEQYEDGLAETDSEPGIVRNNLLAEQNQRVDAEVKASLAAKVEAVRSRELPSSNDYFAIRLEANLAEAMRQHGYEGPAAFEQPNRKMRLPRGLTWR
jgi:hypothetical protein